MTPVKLPAWNPISRPQGKAYTLGQNSQTTDANMNNKPSRKKQPKSEQIPYDDSFKQMMSDTLPLLGLKVIEEPKLGKLPLKADVVLLTRERSQAGWKKHPLWKHLTHHSLIEFKSVSDPFQPGDFEVLLSYTLLYRVKFKVSYTKRLSSWLVVPSINRHLKQTLTHYGIVLKPLRPGFWKSETLFPSDAVAIPKPYGQGLPLYIVEYNHLPFELPYNTLKLFIKSGKPVQEVFLTVLKSKQVEQVKQAVTTIMKLIHPLDAKEVLEHMSITKERKALEKTALEFTKEIREKEKQVTRLEEKQETARKMKAEGIPVSTISKCTGLSEDEIKKLV